MILGIPGVPPSAQVQIGRGHVTSEKQRERAWIGPRLIGRPKSPCQGPRRGLGYGSGPTSRPLSGQRGQGFLKRECFLLFSTCIIQSNC